jgi:hypothetical protein
METPESDRCKPRLAERSTAEKYSLKTNAISHFSAIHLSALQKAIGMSAEFIRRSPFFSPLSILGTARFGAGAVRWLPDFHAGPSIGFARTGAIPASIAPAPFIWHRPQDVTSHLVTPEIVHA